MKLAYVFGHFFRVGHLDGVSDHLLHEILSEDHDLPRAELDAARIRGEMTLGYFLSDVLRAFRHEASPVRDENEV